MQARNDHRDDDGDADRSETNPASDLGQLRRHRLPTNGLLAPRTTARPNRPTPTADAVAPFGKQQSEVTGGRENERNPADTPGNRRRRHGEDREQRQTGDGRTAQSAGEGLDDNRDEPDTGGG